MSRLKEYWEKLRYWLKKHTELRSTQMTIAVSFTVVSVCIMCVLVLMLYRQFSRRIEDQYMENSVQLLNQAAINLEGHLRNMRWISDAMYYSVIKDKDLAFQNMDDEMNLLYEANKDNLVSIACYANDGSLTAAAPINTVKPDVDVTAHPWFVDALEQLENFHFSTPHVQNLFDDPSYRHYWVISLSRSVELNYNGESTLGVLLVDMNYSSIEKILKKVNEDASAEYVYLMDRNGKIIYHPRQDQIYAGIYSENNLAALQYEDEAVQETFEREKRLVTVKTVSYTGWKLVSVVPMEVYSMGMESTRYLVILLVALALFATVILNQLVSARIAKPLNKLNASVKEWEAGNLEPDIYVGGSTEVMHLGKTLRSTVEQIRQLMRDIVVEQEEKRKSELDALQSQINPHFLYNTLDSIVWMITGEKYEEAVFMVTQLASLFRVSLSQGKTIIRIEDELRHAQNYMNIQKIRYKNVFQVDFTIEPEILEYCTVKLILQPLLENAIYYGMEYMDGEGRILVNGFRKGSDIYLEVQDNGPGMTSEEAERLLTEENRERKRGSGVGLINVHSRIRLRFGAQYGLKIESCPDEGTKVTVHIPAILCSAENQKQLEEGKYAGKTAGEEDRYVR